MLSPTDPNVLARALNCTIQVRDHFEHYSPALEVVIRCLRPAPGRCASAVGGCQTQNPTVALTGRRLCHPGHPEDPQSCSAGLTGTLRLGLPVGT